MTKTETQAECRRILNSTKFNTYLSGYEFAFVDEVFRRHHKYAEKVRGCEYRLGVQPSNVNPKNNEFFFEINGVRDHFSYIKAISKPSYASLVKTALRYAVKKQTSEIKESILAKGSVLCPVSGVPLHHGNSHLDHYPEQFDSIVERWLSVNGYTFNDIGLHSLIAGGHCVSDKAVEESFSEFHEKEAKYRLVLDKINLRRKRKGEKK